MQPETFATSDPTVRIRCLAYRLIGTDNGCDFWMTRPLVELRGKTPQEMINQGHADVIEQYLRSALEGDIG